MEPSLSLILAVAVAATYSLTLLVTSDKITDTLRERLLTRLTGHGYTGPARTRALTTGHGCACGARFDTTAAVVDHVHDAREEQLQQFPLPTRARISYLVTCPWCVSLWVAVPVAWSAWCFGTRGWWFVPAVVLAARGVTGTWATLASPGRR